MSDIIADLMHIRERLQANPIPQSIWFIDRDREFYGVMRLVYSQRPQLWPFRMPLRNMKSSWIRTGLAILLEKEGHTVDSMRRLYPFCQPGIWVQMSDGNHQHLEIGD